MQTNRPPHLASRVPILHAVSNFLSGTEHIAQPTMALLLSDDVTLFVGVFKWETINKVQVDQQQEPDEKSDHHDSRDSYPVSGSCFAFAFHLRGETCDR